MTPGLRPPPQVLPVLYGCVNVGGGPRGDSGHGATAIRHVFVIRTVAQTLRQGGLGHVLADGARREGLVAVLFAIVAETELCKTLIRVVSTLVDCTSSSVAASANFVFVVAGGVPGGVSGTFRCTVPGTGALASPLKVGDLVDPRNPRRRWSSTRTRACITCITISAYGAATAQAELVPNANAAMSTFRLSCRRRPDRSPGQQHNQTACCSVASLDFSTSTG